MDSALFTSLKTYALKTFHPVKLGRGTIKFHEYRYSLDPLKFASELRSKMFDAENCPKDLVLLLTERDKFSKYAAALYSDIENSFKEPVAPKVSFEPIAVLVPAKHLKQTLLPVINFDKRDEKYVFDRDSMCLTNINHDAWAAITSPEHKKALIPETIWARLIFDPYNAHYIRKDTDEKTGIEYSVINSYIPPSWSAIEPSSDDLPDFFSRLMVHLFPKDEAREYAFNWLYHALTKRNETYLYLTGGQGIGKTTFTNFCRLLVGDHNAELAKVDFADGRFNGFLKNKRLVIFDEISCRTDKEKNIMKQWTNEFVPVESKGIDQETIRNFCSFIITNNNPKSVTVEPDDRRISIPEITEKRLLESFTMAEVQEMNTQINAALQGASDAVQVVSNIAHWILKHYATPRFANTEPYQKERFYEIVVVSAQPFFKFCIAKVKSKARDSYKMKDLEEDFLTKYSHRYGVPDIRRVEDFFNFYKEGGKTIAKVTVDTLNGDSIDPVNDYVKKTLSVKDL